MNKLILFAACLLLAEEWTTYRCIVSTTIESNGSTTTSLSTIAAKRKNSEIWLRVTQLEPERMRFISLRKGSKTATYFPEEQRIEESATSSNNDNLDIEDLISPLLPQELKASSSVTIALPENFIVHYGADSLKVIRRTNTDSEIDSMTFFKGIIPTLSVVSTKQWLEGKRWLMPISTEIINYSPRIITKTIYAGYRINGEIHDETFDINMIVNE